jgi:multiple sugar transport system substrate-binding protein
VFDNPKAAAGIQFMGDLINKDKVTPAASQMVDSTNIGPLFTAGQVAMAFGNHALIPTLAAASSLQWDVVGLPHFAGYKTVNGGAAPAIALVAGPRIRLRPSNSGSS